MDSAVPYSLSDIQLPDSPIDIVKPAIKPTSKKDTSSTHLSNDSDKDSHSDNDMHRNGLNSATKSHSKVKPVADDASKKIKISIMKSKKPDHQSTESKKSSKTSDIVTESATAQKNKQSKKSHISDSEEKSSKKEEKNSQIADKHPKSHSNSSSEESSASSGTRKKRQPRSKVKYSKISKNRSSSSSSRSSQSQERIPEKLSKEDRSAQKKPIELDALKKSKKRQKEGSNKKISKSRSSSSSNRSSQSRETSPVEISKKDVKQPVMPDGAARIVKKHRTESSSDQQASKSRSQSPSISQSRGRSSVKSSKENAKSTIELDASRIVKKHSKSSSDLKASKSRSSSPTDSRSSRSRERSPVKPTKDSVKRVAVPESSRIARKRHTSSSDKKTSKSRSHSPISSRSTRSRERSPLKPSKKDVKKSSLHDAARNFGDRHTESNSDQKTSKSRSCSPSINQEQSPAKTTKDAKKSVVSDVSKVIKKHHIDSSSKEKTLKSRSRSPSNSQSRERSPLKASKEDIKKLIVHDPSTIVRKRRSESGSDRKTSKSSSRSPCSSRSSHSRERSPMKTSNEGVKKLLKTEDSRTYGKHHTEEKTSKSRSRSPIRSSLSREKSPVNASRNSRKRQTESSGQKTRKNRSRSSSSSPPPHQTLELFFSESKKKKSEPSRENVKAMDRSIKISAPETIGKHNEGSNAKVSATVEQKTDLPRKKLKINRNNVVIQSLESSENVPADEPQKLPSKYLGEETSKVSPSSPKEEKEMREPTSPIQSETIEREMGEIIENSPEVKYEPRKINFPGRKLSRKSSEDLSSTEPKSKKSKWGKFASSQKSSQTINISTDSLKNWFPEFKLVNEPSAVNDSMPEESPPVKEDKRLSFPLKSEEESTKQSSSYTSHQNKEEPTLEVTDSSGPISKIVFIQNLVRPFTLLQLKDLLRQTGSFVEEDFWIDKIKSKCFVTYATEEEAIKTRNALNGSRWPSSNPKILSAEFSTEEEFEHHRSGKDVQKPIPERLPEVHETYGEKIPQPASDHRRKDRDSDKRKDKERYRPQAPVREWDKDKVLQDSPERERADKNMEGFRGSDRKDKKDTKKRMNEDTPAKLLDDLFQKTKSVPCIYWLPLTDALVLEHEESKRLRRLEREKRNQQREKEESELRSKRSRLDHKSREMENRRSSTRSRSPTSRRR